MTSIRYAHFLIDTNVPSSLSDTEVLVARLRLLVSTTLASLRIITSEGGDVSPVKWSFRLFDSRIGHQIVRNQATLPTISTLTSEALTALSTALTQAFSRYSSSSQAKYTSNTTKPTPSSQKKTLEALTRSGKRPSTKSEIVASQHTSYFENVAISVSKAFNDINQSATSLNEHDMDSLSTSKNLTESRMVGRGRKHESLLFILSAYPNTLEELLRSIEKPEDQLQSLSKPPLDRPAALLYGKVKLKPLLDSISKPALQTLRDDLSTQTIWMDTRSWVLTPASLLAAGEVEQMNSFFGAWHRAKASEDMSSMEIERSQTAEWALECGVSVISATAFSSLALTYWPSNVIKQASNLQARPIPKTRAFLFHGDAMIQLTMELIASSPSITSSSSVDHLNELEFDISCKIPIEETLRTSWSRTWLVTCENWHSTLQLLTRDSEALLLVSNSKAEPKLYLLAPVSPNLATILEIDIRRTVENFISAGSETVTSPSLLPPLSQNPSTFLKRADFRAQSSLPRRSAIEVMTQLIGASTHTIPFEESEMLSPSKVTPKTASSLPPLVFEDDEELTTSSPIQPTASKILSSPQASRGGVVIIDSDGIQGITLSSLDDFDPENPEILASTLGLYLSDLYARFLHSLPISTVSHLLPSHLTQGFESQSSLPELDIDWSPSQLFAPSNSPSSLENSIFRSLENLLNVCTSVSFGASTLASVIESKFLIHDDVLRLKYLGEEVNLPAEVSVCDSQLEKDSILTSEKKLIEYRLQVALRFFIWHCTQFSVSKSATKEGGIASSSKKTEIGSSSRKQLFSLLETVAFLYSTKAEMEAFRSYFGALTARMDSWGAPNTIRWLQKRLDVGDETNSSASSSTWLLDRVHSDSNIKPKEEDISSSTFLETLLEATGISIMEPSGRASPASAFALLIENSTPKIPTGAIALDDELEPRKRSSKRSAEDEIGPESAKRATPSTLA